MAQLPPGFVLDAPPASALPPGFVLDEPKSVGGFLQNIPIDAYNTAKGIGEGVYAGGKKLVTDPVGAAKDVYDAANNAGVTAVGGIENAYNMAAPQNMQIARRPEMEMASQVGAGLKDKYYDHLGDTLYNHPVQSAIDASSLLYGGEGLAARTLGEGAMATRALGTAAEITNPLNAVAKPVQAVRNAAVRGSALREMRANAPTGDQIAAQKKLHYDALEQAGINFDANAYNDMLGRIGGKLQKFGDRAPLSNGIFNDMAKKGTQLVRDGSRYGADGQPLQVSAPRSPTFRDVEDMLIEAKRVLRVPDSAGPNVAADKAAAHAILDELAPFFDNGPLTTNGLINPGDVARIAKEARDLGRRHIISRDFSEIERKSKWYPSGDESGMRNQVASYGKRKGAGLTDMEEKAAQSLVKREGLHGILNTGGSKLAQAMMLTGAGGLGFALGGIPGMAIGAGLNVGARAASAAMTNRKFDQFLKTVNAGRDAQEKALLGAKRLPIKTKGLLLGTEGVGLLGGHRAP